MSASATDSVKFANISASTAPFVLKGGIYGVAALATFGGGSVKLQHSGRMGLLSVGQLGQRLFSGWLRDCVLAT